MQITKLIQEFNTLGKREKTEKVCIPMTAVSVPYLVGYPEV